MVNYYNLTDYSSNSGIVSFIKVTSQLTNYMFGYALLLILFLVPLIVMLRKNMSANSAFNYSALFTAFMGIIFYVVGIIQNSTAIYIPAIIFIVTIINRKYSE